MGLVLLVTGSTGGGHNQVADTLRGELEAKGHEVIVSDMLMDFSKVLKFASIDSYNFLYKKLPRLYGLIYRSTDHKFISGLSAQIWYTLMGKKMLEYINEVQPDTIISVHPFGAGVLGKLKEKGYLKCVTTVLVTDFDIHWVHVAKGIDNYIVCSDFTKHALVRRGVEPDNIQSMGIPIKSDFLHKNVHERDDGIFTVLIMGGSGGEKFIQRSLVFIARNEEAQINVVCGNNKALKNRLEKRYKNRENIHIKGYVKDIKPLMSKADVIITKPGAITVTEAISQELPIIIPYAIPGHESANARFLVESGIAFRTRNSIWLAHVVEKIMKKPELMDSIRESIKENTVKYSTAEIVKSIDESCLCHEGKIV